MFKSLLSTHLTVSHNTLARGGDGGVVGGSGAGHGDGDDARDGGVGGGSGVGHGDGGGDRDGVSGAHAHCALCWLHV